MPRLETGATQVEQPPGACSHALGARKLGVVVPSTNTAVEPELYRHLGEDTTLHVARFAVGLTEIPRDAASTEAHLLAYLDGIEDAARRVADTRCHAVGIGFFSETCFWGAQRELEIVDRLRQAARAPVVTAAMALRDALASVGARRVAVVTPYFDAINEVIARYLRECGFEVVAISGHPAETPWAAASCDPDRIAQFFRVVDSDRVDALCSAGTNLAAAKAARRLEPELGKPVIAGNLALLWRLLREVGAPLIDPALGRLFAG